MQSSGQSAISCHTSGIAVYLHLDRISCSRLQVSSRFRQILGYDRDPPLQMRCCEARQQCQNRAKYIYKMCTFLRMQSVSYLNANFSLFARSNLKTIPLICLKDTRNTLMRLFL
jgi:hypothetical protein